MIPGSGRSPGGRYGNPCQYSSQENPIDGGAWQGTVHGDLKVSDTTEATEHTHTHTPQTMGSLLKKYRRIKVSLVFRNLKV